MKVFHYIFLLALLLWAPDISAQKRRIQKAPAGSNMERAQIAIKTYDFEEAETLLSKEIKELHRRRQDTHKAESLLNVARQGKTRLRATECVVFIDSVVCELPEMLSAMKLSRESGKLSALAAMYSVQDDLGAMAYENAFANKRYLALPMADSTQQALLRLAVSDKIGEKWSTPTPLRGLNEDDILQNYPFLLSDGVTLYYAAMGPESMGGYDIFVSRSDDSEDQFLAPENIGFPYNSPDNDYLLAIDELNRLGWLVTDRRQPDGKVCVYTFIPNETRKLYPDDISDSQLRNLARISSIQATWTEDTEAAQQRLALLRQDKDRIVSAAGPSFHFDLDDTRTYTQLSQFRSPIARQLLPQWKQLKNSTETDEQALMQLREAYANATTTERRHLALTIQRIETSLYPNLQSLEKLTKEIRNAELSQK